MSSQCCMHFEQSKNRTKAPQQDQIFSRDTCPPSEHSDRQWARLRTTGLNSSRAAQFGVHSHNIQHKLWWKSLQAPSKEEELPGALRFLVLQFLLSTGSLNRALTIACNTVLHKSAGTRTSEAGCRLCKQRSQEPHSGRDAELFAALVKIWTPSLANTGLTAKAIYYRTM